MARAHSLESADPFEVAVERVARRERVRDRIRLVGAVQIGISSLGVLVGAMAFLAIAPWGLLSGDPTATLLLGGLGSAIAGFFFALSLPGLAAGVGLLRGYGWARTLGIVVAFLQLFYVPVGTLIGGLSLAVLLQDDAREHFELPR